MYLDPTVATAGALRLLQLLLNPFITAGLQSAASPNNGLPSGPVAAPAVAPPRQLSGNDLFAQAAALGSAPPMAAVAPPSSGTVMPGGMTMAAMPPMPYAPWLFSPQLTAVVPNAPNGPVYVPPSVVPSLLSGSSGQAGQTGQTAPNGAPASSATSLVAVLEQAIAPYTQGAAAAASGAADETASPMPMASLLSVLSSLASGIRVVVVNFAASVAVMGAAQLARIVVQNLPIILNLLGLTRASMARVIVAGVTRAQCLERAACLLGQHASTYPSTPDVLRWLRSPDPAAAVSVEHPVWRAFRSAAEGTPMQCDAFAC